MVGKGLIIFKGVPAGADPGFLETGFVCIKVYGGSIC